MIHVVYRQCPPCRPRGGWYHVCVWGQSGYIERTLTCVFVCSIKLVSSSFKSLWISFRADSKAKLIPSCPPYEFNLINNKFWSVSHCPILIPLNFTGYMTFCAIFPLCDTFWALSSGNWFMVLDVIDLDIYSYSWYSWVFAKNTYECCNTSVLKNLSHICFRLLIVPNLIYFAINLKIFTFQSQGNLSNESMPVTLHRMSFTIQRAVTSTKKNIFKGRVEVIGSLLLTKLEFTYKVNGHRRRWNVQWVSEITLCKLFVRIILWKQMTQKWIIFLWFTFSERCTELACTLREIIRCMPFRQMSHNNSIK